MSDKQLACLVCERTSQEIPLISLEFQDRKFYICPQHFPILIHNPGELTGKLPGVENLQPHEQ
jgi:hypothetical protein